MCVGNVIWENVFQRWTHQKTNLFSLGKYYNKSAEYCLIELRKRFDRNLDMLLEIKLNFHTQIKNERKSLFRSEASNEVWTKQCIASNQGIDWKNPGFHSIFSFFFFKAIFHCYSFLVCKNCWMKGKKLISTKLKNCNQKRVENIRYEKTPTNDEMEWLLTGNCSKNYDFHL